MNRKIPLVVLLILAVSFSTAYAGIGFWKDGVYQGEASGIDVTGSATNTFDGNLANIPIDANLMAMGLYNGDVTTVGTGLSALPSIYRMVLIDSTTSDSLVLANGISGQVLRIIKTTNTPSTNTITITPTTSYGWTSATMDTPNEELTLLYIDDTYGWVVLEIRGATVAY